MFDVVKYVVESALLCSAEELFGWSGIWGVQSCVDVAKM